MVSGKERNWKTEDKWVSGRVLIIVGNIERIYAGGKSLQRAAEGEDSRKR